MKEMNPQTNFMVEEVEDEIKKTIMVMERIIKEMSRTVVKITRYMLAFKNLSWSTFSIDVLSKQFKIRHHKKLSTRENPK